MIGFDSTPYVAASERFVGAHFQSQEGLEGLAVLRPQTTSSTSCWLASTETAHLEHLYVKDNYNKLCYQKDSIREGVHVNADWSFMSSVRESVLLTYALSGATSSWQCVWLSGGLHLWLVERNLSQYFTMQLYGKTLVCRWATITLTYGPRFLLIDRLFSYHTL
jgi:hypothetical protein